MNESATLATLSGRYQLEERIGAGGAGEVWRALDTSLGRHVAVKVLHPSLADHGPTVERFKREAASAAALSHPNIVVIYDVGHDDTRDYLVMEHVDGIPLSGILQDGAMPPDTVAALGAQIADALASAHDVGLIHRDIKPANILLSREGSAKVADFGIAKVVGDSTSRLTATGTVVGSAAYVAPEQLRDHDIDGRADIYALGLLLHECVTGERPWGGGTPVEVAARRLNDDPPAPSQCRPDIPAELDDAIVRATHLDRDQRFASAAAFAETLRALAPEDGLDHLAELVRRLAPREPDSTAVLPRDERYGDTALEADETARLDAADEVPARGPEHDRGVTAPQPALDRPSPSPVDDVSHGQREPGRDRTPFVAAGVLLLAVAAVAALLTGGGSDDGEASDGGTVGPIAIAAAQDFDPFGDREHPEDVAKAYDGDVGTVWTTQRYNSPDLGGLKSGVGIWFDLGEASPPVGTVNLTLTEPGTDLQIITGATPPQGDPNTWGMSAAAQANAPNELSLEIPEGSEGRYVLVWITKLAGSRTQIAEVSFLPR